ncbi:hypothetical protein [Lentzea sp. NPDC051838]|uniref:hypothetical protein n=1 Tax=Lentzea sp. NPDC051838 TaxID=3154849 RepID=UPI0034209EBD
MLVVGAVTGAGISWPGVVPLVVSTIAAVVLRRWFRQQAPLDPARWLPATAFAVAAQLLVGAVPTFVVAWTATNGAGRGVAGVLMALCCLLGAGMCWRARRASRTLLTPLVPELGSADVRLTLPLRESRVRAGVVVERDRIEWAAKSVGFDEVRHVTPVELPVEPSPRWWLASPDGTTVEARPGPGMLIEGPGEAWLLPVQDSELATELVNRRRALWIQGNR